MAELRFLDRQLRPYSFAKQQKNENDGNKKKEVILDGRFTVIKPSGWYMDQSVFVARDMEDSVPCLLYINRKDVDNGYRDSNFTRFLSECEGVRGWPKLIKRVSLEGVYSGIITSEQGETLKIIFGRTFAISYKNAVRLCYQLFALLDTMHMLGYVHRAIDTDSIRGHVDWNYEFVLGLNAFRYATRMEPAPACYGMQWKYSSVYVGNNLRYNRLDDFISVIYVILTSQGNDMLLSNADHAMGRKLAFHEDPHAFLTDNRLHWIANVYQELVHQRQNGFNREAISALLDSAVEGFDPSSPLEWSILPGSSDVRLNPENVMVVPRVHAPEPIRVPHH